MRRSKPLFDAVEGRDAGGRIVWYDSTPVCVPRSVVALALRKAKFEYERRQEAEGNEPFWDPDVNPYECWAEFEALADYLEMEDEDGNVFPFSVPNLREGGRNHRGAGR